ncbi:hypothetical protein GmHk_09G025543 [Glycine max]|nr:hypothetical protein GmHk_09G025543 [Glycine max]
MSDMELYIEKDVAGGSMFHSANSLTSCGNKLSNNEAQPPRNVSNLHGDEDDDDDYLVSNSYVEESLDEDDSVDGISDTDDEVTDMIQPDFFCPDVSPFLLGQPQQKIGDANQHLISHLYQDTDKSVLDTEKMLVVCNTFHGHAPPFVGNILPLQQPPFACLCLEFQHLTGECETLVLEIDALMLDHVTQAQ